MSRIIVKNRCREGGVAIAYIVTRLCLIMEEDAGEGSVQAIKDGGMVSEVCQSCKALLGERRESVSQKWGAGASRDFIR